MPVRGRGAPRAAGRPRRGPGVCRRRRRGPARRHRSPASSPAWVPPEPSATTTQSTRLAAELREQLVGGVRRTRSRRHRRAADRDRERAAAVRRELRARGRRCPPRCRSSRRVRGRGGAHRARGRAAGCPTPARCVGAPSLAGAAIATWHSRPSRFAAAAVIRTWLLCGPPPVTSTSHPSASASAHRSSSLRALLPPSASPVQSSRLTSRRGPRSTRRRAHRRAGPSARAASAGARARGPTLVGRHACVAALRRCSHHHTTTPAAAATSAPPTASVRTRRDGEPVAESHRTHEAHDGPALVAGEPREVAVGVHRDGMADRPEHRLVGHRVAVRVRRRRGRDPRVPRSSRIASALCGPYP